MWEWFERTETATGYPNAFRICKVSVAEFGIVSIINTHCLWLSFIENLLQKRIFCVREELPEH